MPAVCRELLHIIVSTIENADPTNKGPVLDIVLDDRDWDDHNSNRNRSSKILLPILELNGHRAFRFPAQRPLREFWQSSRRDVA